MNSPRNAEPATLDQAILQTVVYADVFDYPLRADEIHRYLTGLSASPEQIELRLRSLVPARLRCSGGAYCLPGREEILAGRERRERIARRLWPQALRCGRLIASLPFVRMLAVTGSLAMNNVEAGADLDYLIVTAPGRLWLCRALVLALGRLVGLQGVRVCPNYLISEGALEFPDQGLYAAHEMAQMVPLAGWQVYEHIRRSNTWVERYLPNAQCAPGPTPPEEVWGSVSWPKSALEAILLTPPGSWIEKWEAERKIRKLRAENGDNAEASFSMDLCKGHSNRHRGRTEFRLHERLEQFLPEANP